MLYLSKKKGKIILSTFVPPSPILTYHKCPIDLQLKHGNKQDTYEYIYNTEYLSTYKYFNE